MYARTEKVTGMGKRPVNVVFSYCFFCGAEARGYVANSRRGMEIPDKIAKQWVAQLNDGTAKLFCVNCLKNRSKDCASCK